MVRGSVTTHGSPSIRDSLHVSVNTLVLAFRNANHVSVKDLAKHLIGTDVDIAREPCCRGIVVGGRRVVSGEYHEWQLRLVQRC